MQKEEHFMMRKIKIPKNTKNVFITFSGEKTLYFSDKNCKIPLPEKKLSDYFTIEVDIPDNLKKIKIYDPSPRSGAPLISTINSEILLWGERLKNARVLFSHGVKIKFSTSKNGNSNPLPKNQSIESSLVNKEWALLIADVNEEVIGFLYYFTD